MKRRPFFAAVIIFGLGQFAINAGAEPPQAYGVDDAEVRQVDYRGKPPFKRQRARVSKDQATPGSSRFRGRPPFNRAAVRAAAPKTLTTQNRGAKKTSRRRGPPGKSLPR
ncbi:MAG: hypothetical protein AB8G16_12785 [Gammaproteobacteria bacterium]